MFSNELVGKKCGYLDVKVPSKVRGRGIKAWKAWKKRWVVVHGMTNLSTKCPVVTIDMYSHENREGHQLERSTIYLERVESICRTRSKSHLYAFSIDAHETLLYLSGYSETDSQRWIAAFKHILCPKITVPALHSSVGQVFNATIIESLSCYANRFNATVGYIIALPSVVLLAGLNDGCILAEWPLTTILQVSVVKEVAHQEDKNKILMMEISNVASHGGIFHFYSDVALTLEATLSKNTSNWRTSASNYSTWHKSGPIHFRKNSEDVTGGQKWIGNNELILTKALSAENLHTSSILCRPLPPKPIFDSEEKIVPVKKLEATPIVIDKQATVKHRHASSCNDLYKQRDNVKISIMDKRKCRSDTTLAHQTNNENRRRASLSPSPPHDKSIPVVVETFHREEDKITAISSIANDKHFLHIAQTRPLSVYSSTSQASRDSGVMLSAPEEENCQIRPSRKTEAFEASLASENNKSRTTDVKRWSLEDNESVAYRHFSEFIQEPEQLALYQNQEDRLSTSSDSTLYSEIDTFFDVKKDDDPLYEDLDKFRKNIHKLLGIPQNVGVNSVKPNSEQTSPIVPPPLPPRRYKRGMSRKLSTPQVRRKDVMKYLGVDSEKFYGSLDKLPQIGTSQRLCDTTTPNGTMKRKDIYRYLGIPAMAASQPAGLNTVAEQTYDCPTSTLQIPNQKTASLRKSTRTYVRVPSLHGNVTSTGTVTDTKTSKKSRISFLKRKPSSKDISDPRRHSRTNSSTYVSYDSCFTDDWASIGVVSPSSTTDPNLESSSQIATSTTAETEPTSLVTVKFVQLDCLQADAIIEEKYVEEQVQSDEEHYCVPSSVKTATLEITESSKCPVYVNLAELQMEANMDNSANEVIVERGTFSAIDIAITKCLEEEKDSDESDVSADSNYMDMSVLSSKRTSPLSSLLVVARDKTDHGGHRNSEYMEMDFAGLRATSTDSETDDRSSSPSTDPNIILESVMVCINQLQAICNTQVFPNDSSTLDLSSLHLTPLEQPELELRKPEAESINSESETTARSSLEDVEAPIEIEKQDTKLRQIQRLTSEEISAMVNRMSLDEEAASILQQRLSSYIDQLFASSHNIEDDTTRNTFTDIDDSIVEDVLASCRDDDISQNDPSISEDPIEIDQ